MKKKILFASLLFILFAHSGLYAQYVYSLDDDRNSIYYSPQVMNLFPNPAINNATVVLNYMPQHKVYIDVVDFNGQLLRRFAFSPRGQQLSFDVSDLDRGFYILRVREQNMLIDVVKLVKN